MVVKRRVLLGGCLATLTVWNGLLVAAAADSVLLTLHNPAIEGTHGKISFSRRDLEALDWSTIVTSNEFIDGVSEFRGPPAHAVLSQIGHAGASRVRLTSASDFFVDVDVAELEEFGAILAMERDGEPLSLRDQGPIWLMYPLDDHPELQDSRFNSRLVWHLTRIELF